MGMKRRLWEWLKEEWETAAIGGMSQVEPLALVVVVDKEPDRSPQGFERATETAMAPRSALEIGAQVRIHAFNRVGFFFAHRQDMLPACGPDDLAVDRLIYRSAAGKVSTMACKVSRPRSELTACPTISPVSRATAITT
jgi:hypothetical protein